MAWTFNTRHAGVPQSASLWFFRFPVCSSLAFLKRLIRVCNIGIPFLDTLDTDSVCLFSTQQPAKSHPQPEPEHSAFFFWHPLTLVLLFILLLSLGFQKKKKNNTKTGLQTDMLWMTHQAFSDHFLYYIDWWITFQLTARGCWRPSRSRLLPPAAGWWGTSGRCGNSQIDWFDV